MKKEEMKNSSNKRERTTTTTTRTSEVAREFYYSSRIFSSRCATSTSSDFCDEIFGYHPNAAWMMMKMMKRNEEEEEEDKCSDYLFAAHSAKEKKMTTIHEPKVHTWTSIAKSLFAGGIAGGVSRTAVAPLERLKILQQVHGRTATEYGTVYRGLNTILRKDGLRGFFIGNGANCIRIVPNSAVKFFCYERITDAIFQFRRTLDPECEMNVFNRLAGGAGAGIIAMTSVYPLDMVRGRLTVQAGTVHQYNGMVDATRKIIQHEGVGSLYKGLLPSVIGVIPYVGLNFAVYETLKDMLAAKLELKSSKELSVAQSLTCGGFAGAVGQTVAYPFDVVRRRLQVAGWQGSASKTMEKAKYSGMMDCFGKIARYEGVGAFFHGLSANYIKVMPSIAIAFVTYEEVKRVLQVDLHISSGG
tara:strand:+ start:38 stop:1282 length:1245 start_codon:yes stop_codon:yes gene_type:complete